MLTEDRKLREKMDALNLVWKLTYWNVTLLNGCMFWNEVDLCLPVLSCYFCEQFSKITVAGENFGAV